MSQISLGGHEHANGTAHAHGRIEPQVAARERLRSDQVICPRGQFAKLSGVLMLAGLAAIALTLVMGMGGGEGAGKQAMSAYHTGALYCIGLSLGCLGIQMIFQQFNAGWSAVVRRQAENAASLIWVAGLIFAPVVLLNVFVLQGESRTFSWMDPAHTAGDPLFENKKGWLDLNFWMVRSVVYILIWTIMALTLRAWSLKQDKTGDRWLTAKARKLSSVGLAIFALSTAFAAFDWLMSKDYHWFSTMFGVYFFAGCVVSAISMLILVLALLVKSGKLQGICTSEHFHDMGKMLFAFTVFWAYVSFSQYFLIWYSNIPEESAFYNLRSQHGYEYLGVILCGGHFILPFLVVLFRKVKRTPGLLMLVALWMLLMHGVDLIYMVRPTLKSVQFGHNWHLDVLGLVGPVLVFTGLILRRAVSVPLIPLKDPRLHEALEHKNYV